MQKIRLLGRRVRALARGQTNKQTDKHTQNGPKTEDLWNFFFQLLFLFLHWRSNKRIAELQQTAGPLKLGVSKIEMAVSRSNIFGSPIWFIYTFYTAKGNINTKYRSRMYSILDTIRKSNIKISIPHNSKRGAFFLVKYFLLLFNFNSLVYMPKIRFLPLLRFP